MFEHSAPKEKRSTDWSGTIIGVMLLPVFFLFVYLGKAEMGFNLVIVLGMVLLAVKLRWRLRKHAWFWPTIIFILALHVPLLFVVRWPDSNVPTIVYSMPLAIADLFLILGALSLAEKVFSKNSSSTGEDA
ncbi:MAG TPA: hypothetical protein VFW98_17660 [Gemmatimonadaceae bacterium]|nr:hypothetical protein [Gemmatimonadaceae bacterium]